MNHKFRKLTPIETTKPLMSIVGAMGHTLCGVHLSLLNHGAKLETSKR
jgi:hypothetical protein